MLPPMGKKYNFFFLFPQHQISMSAPRIPIRVMKTLIAPTLTVLTAVLANKDSLEMAEHVKVFANVAYKMYLCACVNVCEYKT